MSLKLSILDPSPMCAERTAQDAFAETLALARFADQAGFHRYWVQEHHNSPSFAGTAPEILISAIAAQTSRLRVGSGGIMLPNYSPLKVAEQFVTLEALYPGRIDLGIGRATGADKKTTPALLGPGIAEFPAMLNLLLSWLLDSSGEQAIQDGHPAAGVRARPLGGRPEVWMLCSSEESAAFAGAMGVNIAFADFLSPGLSKDALAAYRENFAPSAFAARPHAAVALVALAAETEDEARRLDATRQAWAYEMAKGRFWPFPKAEEAADILAMIGSDPVLEQIRGRAIVGTGALVRQQITRLAKDAKADEVLLMTFTCEAAARFNSYKLIADAFAAVPA
jgi:luciferase family oxidoreductase group 1